MSYCTCHKLYLTLVYYCECYILYLILVYYCECHILYLILVYYCEFHILYLLLIGVLLYMSYTIPYIGVLLWMSYTIPYIGVLLHVNVIHYILYWCLIFMSFTMSYIDILLCVSHAMNFINVLLCIVPLSLYISYRRSIHKSYMPYIFFVCALWPQAESRPAKIQFIWALSERCSIFPKITVEEEVVIVPIVLRSGENKLISPHCTLKYKDNIFLRMRMVHFLIALHL